MPSTRKSAEQVATGKSSGAFTDEERAAMKDRAAEVKTARRRGKSDPEADAKAVLDKIAELEDEDRELAERVHAAVSDAAPELAPKLWYGMPAYAKDGRIVCFFQPAAKFKARYATLGFNDPANLDEGSMWPTSYAITNWTGTNEKKVRALVRKAAR